MNIVLLSQYFHPEAFSNTDIALELQRHGHRVEVVCGVPNYPVGQFHEGYSNSLRREDDLNGIPVHRARTVARGSRKLTLALNFVTFPLTGCWTILRKLRTKPDVVFASQLTPVFQVLPGIVYKWLRNVPLVIWVQDIWPESATDTLGIRSAFAQRALMWACGWIYRRADLILVQNHAFIPMIERFGIPADQIKVMPNTAPDGFVPIDPDAPSTAAVLVPQDGFRLMFAGNIGASQDFPTLIEAAVQLKHRSSLQWIIVGSGRGLEAAQKLVREKGISDRFHFLGRHPMERMPDFFAQADAMVVSLKDTPIFARTVPYKVQSYLACAKPVIAALNGEGARVLSESKAAFVAPAEQPVALAQAIEDLLDLSPEARMDMAHNARAYFDATYAQDKVYGDLEAWLQQTITSKP